MKSHVLYAPLWVPQTKTTGKKFHINLNVYRNTHYQTLNTVKIRYKEIMHSQIMMLPVFTTPIRIAYRVYPATKRLFDLANVVSIHEKFFCDALVEAGKLPDDNYEYIVESRSLFGRVDKQNPRVGIYIRPV